MKVFVAGATGAIGRQLVPRLVNAGHEVHGSPGALFVDDQERVLAVWALDVIAGQVGRIRSVVNPDKLAQLGPVGDAAAVLRPTR